MFARVAIASACLLFMGSGALARTCYIVECPQLRPGESCTIRSCNTPQGLRCDSRLYTVGDGYRVFRNISEGACAQRCEDDDRCDYLEYYYGREGVKCNLYAGRPAIRWNPSQDATVCTWR